MSHQDSDLRPYHNNYFSWLVNAASPTQITRIEEGQGVGEGDGEGTVKGGEIMKMVRVVGTKVTSQP